MIARDSNAHGRGEASATTGPDFLETLARGLDVILALGQLRSATISQVSQATSLPKPSVRRVLHTLCSLGYAEMTGRTFALMPKVTRLAAAYLGTSGQSRVLQARCEALSVQCQEIVLCAVRDGDEQVNVAFATPPNFVGVAQGVGSRFPIYRTAAGRVLLSQLNDQDLDRYLARLQPEQVTPATVTDKDALRSAILKVRSQGFAIVDGESFIAFRSVAFPIHRTDGRLFGAVSINAQKGPQLTDESFGRLVRLCEAEATAFRGLIV